MTISVSRQKTLARPDSYAITSGQALQTHRPALYSLEMHYPSGVSSPCVPVSATVNPCPGLETGEPTGHSHHKYEVAEAIHTLIDYGFSIGCDGELLPPRWLRVER